MKKLLGSLLLILMLAAFVRAEDVATLATRLQSSDPEVRRTAAKALEKMGPEAKPAIPNLMQALRDPDSFVRRFSALALGKIGPEANLAIPALVAALDDKEKRVVEAAAASLGKVGPAAAPALNDILKDKKRDLDLRLHAVETLGRLGPEARDTVPTLIEVLKEKEVRMEAVAALGEIGPEAKAAIEPLTDITKNPKEDGNFKKAATAALKKIDVPK